MKGKVKSIWKIPLLLSLSLGISIRAKASDFHILLLGTEMILADEAGKDLSDLLQEKLRASGFDKVHVISKGFKNASTLEISEKGQALVRSLHPQMTLLLFDPELQMSRDALGSCSPLKAIASFRRPFVDRMFKSSIEATAQLQKVVEDSGGKFMAIWVGNSVRPKSAEQTLDHCTWARFLMGSDTLFWEDIVPAFSRSGVSLLRSSAFFQNKMRSQNHKTFLEKFSADLVPWVITDF